MSQWVYFTRIILVMHLFPNAIATGLRKDWSCSKILLFQNWKLRLAIWFLPFSLQIFCCILYNVQYHQQNHGNRVHWMVLKGINDDRSELDGEQILTWGHSIYNQRVTHNIYFDNEGRDNQNFHNQSLPHRCPND